MNYCAKGLLPPGSFYVVLCITNVYRFSCSRFMSFISFRRVYFRVTFISISSLHDCNKTRSFVINLQTKCLCITLKLLKSDGFADLFVKFGFRFRDVLEQILYIIQVTFTETLKKFLHFSNTILF